jgi:hypothetical protein
MDELLKAIKAKIAAMKKIEKTGFSDQTKAAEYFQEKEIILEEIVQTLEILSVQETSEVEALKSTVKSLREEIKGQAKYPKELSRRELLYNLGKGIAAAWSSNQKALADLAFTPNMKSENWTNPKDVSWVKRAGSSQRPLWAERPLANRWGTWRLTTSI